MHLTVAVSAHKVPPRSLFEPRSEILSNHSLFIYS